MLFTESDRVIIEHYRKFYEWGTWKIWSTLARKVYKAQINIVIKCTILNFVEQKNQRGDPSQIVRVA